MGNFREAAERFGQCAELPMEGQEQIGGLHFVVLIAETFKAPGQAAVAGIVEMLPAVVVAKALATEGG